MQRPLQALTRVLDPSDPFERARAHLLADAVATLEQALPSGTPGRRGEGRAMWDVLLDDLTVDELRMPLRNLAAGPGGELDRTAAGNQALCSAESSALMAVNLLSPFTRRAGLFGLQEGTVTFEHQLRVQGVRSPVGPTPDVTVATASGSVAIEAKTVEPWRSRPKVSLSEQYDAPAHTVSDETLHVLQMLRAGALSYRCLDAAQLLKHLLGIHSAIVARALTLPVSLVLLYWRPSDAGRHAPMFTCLAEEIADLAARLEDQPVTIRGMSTTGLLEDWSTPTAPQWLRDRVPRLRARYDVALSSGQGVRPSRGSAG